jgi:hypothetical protein
MRTFLCLAFALGLAAISCGSDESDGGSSGSSGTGGSGGTGTGGTGGTTETGGTGGSAGEGGTGPTDLRGTWNIVGTPTDGAPQSATLELEASRLAISNLDFSFDLSLGASPQLVWSWKHGDPEVFPLVRDASTPVDTGALGLDVGGAWTATGQKCNFEVGTDKLMSFCDSSSMPGLLPDLDTTVNGTRNQAGGSIFGDLGGTWTFQNEEGATCNVSVAGQQLTIQCAGTGKFYDGSVTVTFGDEAISGSTSSGLEFSAIRQ